MRTQVGFESVGLELVQTHDREAKTHDISFLNGSFCGYKILSILYPYMLTLWFSVTIVE